MTHKMNHEKRTRQERRVRHIEENWAKEQARWLEFAGRHADEDDFCASIAQQSSLTSKQILKLGHIARDNSWPTEQVVRSYSERRRQRRQPERNTDHAM